MRHEQGLVFLLRMCAPHVAVVIVPSDHHILPKVNTYNLPVAEEN